MSYVALPPSDSVPLPADPDSSNTTEAGNESHSEKPTSKPPPPERQWAYISDTIVRLTTREEVLKAKAYLCLYERV